MYKYELHLHTMETSRCGHVRAADQVRTYHKLGFQGLCVTDHLHNSYIDLMDCHDDWHECIRRYLYGYRLAKARSWAWTSSSAWSSASPKTRATI